MRNISAEARLVMNTRRNFVNYADVTLYDGTILHLKPSDFRISGNNFTDDWCDSESFQLGSVIGKTATLVLDNTDNRIEYFYTLQTSQPADWSSNFNDYYIKEGSDYIPVPGTSVPTWTANTYYTRTSTTYPHGKFSSYDFYMSYFSLYVHLPDSVHVSGVLQDTVIPIGTFTVTTPASHGSTIEITGVDNMYMFDKSFDDCTLDFNNGGNGRTLLEILNRCCADCGVAIGYSQTFLNYNIRVHKKPSGITYREVVSYIVQIAGCNAKISVSGALTFGWYNMAPFYQEWYDGGSFSTNTTPYSDGDTADGGNFNPWNTGAVIDGGFFTDNLDYHNLTATNGTSISTDDIQFTGLMVSYEVEVDGSTETRSLHYPNVANWDDYAMQIEGNPFIEDATTANRVAVTIWDNIKDLKFRVFSCSSIQDPTIESGDCAMVYDVKGNSYTTVITNVTFKTGGMTELSCKAESPVHQNQRYVNPAAKAVAKARAEMDAYNAMVAHFNEIANAALGYYKTDVPGPGGSTTTYYHDRPTLAASTNIVKINASGIFISDDGGQSYNSGVDVTTATMLMNLIYVRGLNADWITAGKIDVNRLNIDGIMTAYNNTGTVTISGGKITASSITGGKLANGTVTGTKIASTTIDGGNIKTNTITATNIQDSTITGTKIASTTIDGGNIKTDTITATNIAANAITSSELNSNAVTADKISANAVTSAKISTGAITATKISSNAVTADKISSNAVTSTKISANAVTSEKINAGAIIADKISTGAVTADKITSNAVTSDKINAGAVVADKISTGAVTADKINTGAVTADKISAGAVNADKLSSNAVTADKINAGAVTADKISSNAVTADKIDAGAVTANKISSNAVTSDKINAGAVTANKINVSSLEAISVNVGPWQIDSSGFTNGVNAWIAPYDISCGKYGATLIGMRGKSNSNSGYLEVGVNDGRDCIRVGYNYIRKYDASGNYVSVEWPTSDRRLKKNIKNLTVDEAKDLIQKVRPRKYEFKSEKGIRYGFIAQELREVLDDDCAIECGGDDEKAYHVVNYNDFVPALCAVVKSQQEEIDMLKQEVELLKQLVNAK